MIAGVRGRVARLQQGYLARPFTSVQLLLLSGAVLLTFGVLMSVSTSISAATSNNKGTLWTQMANEALFIALGVPILWLGARIPPRVYRMLVYPVLLLAAMMLLAVFVPHVGVQINDARRWLKVGPMQIQPSEFAKLAMLLWAADLLARREERDDLRSPGRILWPVLPGFLLVSVLVVVEPDLGTTLCLLTLLMGLLWTVGLPYRYFAAVAAMMAGLVTLVAVYDSRRLQRITSFLHPLSDTSNTGHQALQGLYALSSGGIFGVGLGAGPLKFGYVPNANTDYVFAIIGEELGLLGCLFVLAGFGLFAYAALRVARRSGDCFTRLAASGAAVWICGQALINIGYVTGLLPVTGIPLPFVSAGGTSLVLTMGVLGMLVSFARHEPAAVTAARAAAEAGHRSGFARWTRLGLPRVAVPVMPRAGQLRAGTPRAGQLRAGTRRAAERSTDPRSAQARSGPGSVRSATAHSARSAVSAHASESSATRDAADHPVRRRASGATVPPRPSVGNAAPAPRPHGAAQPDRARTAPEPRRSGGRQQAPEPRRRAAQTAAEPRRSVDPRWAAEPRRAAAQTAAEPRRAADRPPARRTG